ncbi:FtsK/SpoIIIE domain-containing protein [Shimia thalassica]|uniref:FtsK/SpoIIIE domain-containing protein n=1 Tax=Shimia thalassica TaxID=1715693 RepID=UPI0027331AEB|nr:FtsK/SpoIIIE domain-containing protein [Shimia thalassica]MDP2495536.1 FtsK/SpoIIIE domain-containing protein [Shimia thalassica]
MTALLFQILIQKFWNRKMNMAESGSYIGRSGSEEAMRKRCDLIGKIVWDFVQSETPPETKGRSIFMLTGLSPDHIAGVSRMFPQRSDQKIRLAIDPRIDPDLLSILPVDHLSEAPPVRFRNSDESDIVVIVVRDFEREAVGTSLGEVIRIDCRNLQDKTEFWCDAIREKISPTEPLSETQENWLSSLISGLNASGFAKDFDQFAEFFQEFVEFPEGTLFGQRVRELGPILGIPRNTFDRIPSEVPGGSKASKNDFKKMFRTAETSFSGIPYLLGSDDKRLDTDQIQQRVQEFRSLKEKGEAVQDLPSEELLNAIDAVLLEKMHLRHGDWLTIQANLCHLLDWKKYGESLFGVKPKKKTKSLAEKTRDFFTQEHAGKLGNVEEFLASIEDPQNAPGKVAEEEFFDEYETEIRVSKPLYDQWRRHLFADSVQGEPDLLTAILEGTKTLLVVNSEDGSVLPHDSKIILSSKNCQKVSTWLNLSKRVYALFRLEGQLLQGILSESIIFDLGKWLDEDVVEGSGTGSGKDNTIEIELRIESSDPETNKGFQKVRVFWAPSNSSGASISLAWPEDLTGLLKGMRDSLLHIPKAAVASNGTGLAAQLPVSLSDTSSFTDVCGGQEGRTADPADWPRENDVFKLIKEELASLADRKLITSQVHVELTHSVDDFHREYSAAVEEIWRNPGKAYKSGRIKRQAELFGSLCSKARMRLSDLMEARGGVLREICEFGVLRSEDSHSVAIIPAWHPLRLFERQEKAKMIGNLISTLYQNAHVSVDGLEMSSRKYKEILDTWCYPEIVSMDGDVYSAVEHCGGYSVAVPVSANAGSQTLEASARAASQQFMLVAEEYLSLNPHEENNFSTAIYNAETVSLPERIADDLEKKMQSRDHLRCSLLITHDKPIKMREAYALQTAMLKGKDVSSSSGGFLSRLRVGVRPGTGGSVSNRRPDIDVVFLHEAFFRHSEIAWDFVEGASDSLPDYLDLTENLLPRRQVGEEGGQLGARLVQVALSPLKLPRAIAQFIDLCYVVHKDVGAISDDRRAIPIRRVSWDNDAVKSAIHNAHDLAEWVVSFDRLSSREMLAGNDIKVIRDILVPDTEARLLVSSREPNKSLLRYISSDLARMDVPLLKSDPTSYADLAIKTVVKVAGQKVMGAARSEKTAREIIGLAAATGLVEAIQKQAEIGSVWFSLDDNKSHFGLKGKLADTLAIGVHLSDEGNFIVDMTVVEAKCIAGESFASEAKGSREQAIATMNVLRSNFSEQRDPVAKCAWGADLLRLLSLRPEFANLLETRSDLFAFKEALVHGRVQYNIYGRSVIVVHDDESPSQVIEGTVSAEDSHLVQHRVGQQGLGRLFEFIEDPDTIDTIDIKGAKIEGRIGTNNVVEVAQEKIVSNSGKQVYEQTAPTGLELTNPESATEHEPSLPLMPDSHETGISDSDVYRNDLATNEPVHEALVKIAHTLGSTQESEEDNEFAKRVSRKLQSALMGYGMQAEFTSSPITTTPNVIIVRFKGHDTLTAKKVATRKEELKSTHALDLINVRSGLGEVGFYLARPKRQIVSLADLWLRANWPSTVPNSLTSFFIGTREDTGEPLWLNLVNEFGGNSQHGTHTLIAGETGSGKGVLIQNLLLQMIAFNSPKNLKLFLIDPKMGADFFWISEAPHLVGGISATQEESESVLDGLVSEMDRRYRLITEARTPNIYEYNMKVSEEDKLPRIVIFHDEMADWMADSPEYRKMIQGKMTRLASKARACGMNIFLITQRASQDAIPVSIRDNLNNRLCLKVASKAGSEIALNMPGGELLLGRGHLAANLNGDKPDGSEHFTAQVPFAKTSDLEALGRAAIDFWRGQFPNLVNKLNL